MSRPEFIIDDTSFKVEIYKIFIISRRVANVIPYMVGYPRLPLYHDKLALRIAGQKIVNMTSDLKTVLDIPYLDEGGYYDYYNDIRDFARILNISIRNRSEDQGISAEYYTKVVWTHVIKYEDKILDKYHDEIMTFSSPPIKDCRKKLLKKLLDTKGNVFALINTGVKCWFFWKVWRLILKSVKLDEQIISIYNNAVARCDDTVKNFVGWITSANYNLTEFIDLTIKMKVSNILIPPLATLVYEYLQPPKDDEVIRREILSLI